MRLNATHLYCWLVLVRKLCEALDAVCIIRVPRYEHVAQPEGDVVLLQLLSKAHSPQLPQPRQPCILLWVQVLDAEQHHVCMGQDMVPVLSLGALACCVQAGGEAQSMRLTEHCCCEVGLQQRLSTTACNAPTTWLQVGCDTAEAGQQQRLESNGVLGVTAPQPCLSTAF